MKSLRLTIAALATAAIATTASQVPAAIAQSESSTAAKATQTLIAQNKQNVIGAQEVDQSRFILSTNPTSNFGGVQRYGLMIIEQKTDARLCYETEGSSPTRVIPLLSTFDFSGICGRGTDTNGYAVRAGGEQVRYNPVLREENGVLVLYAEPSAFLGDAEPFIIGQTDGIAAGGYTQIFLKPGWRLTQRTVDGQPRGAVYLTNDLTVAQITGQEVVVEPGGGDQSGDPVDNGTPTAPSSNFGDIAGDIYQNEINRAVQLGFIAGTTPTTFGPTQSLTREQIVSIVVEGLGVAPSGTVTSSGFSDVVASRWSAAKIKKAQELNIVTGDGNGVFRPTDEVTRAELIAIMRRAAEYKNSTTTLVANQTGETFTDIDGHWANAVINDLSGYCGIATALNETGSGFYPNQPAKRNYAAAAMVRLLDCTQANTPAAGAQ
ncbi:MAG: DUF3747 domain-containing protein [Cyanobacteria bacterium J06627_28]